MRFQPARLFRVALAASLSLSALLYFLWSWRWPLVGDSSLIHYIGWLIQRGWAPYRQLGDMNMPGSYLIEIAAMHLFGAGALAWRFFDFSLMAAAAASFFVIARHPRAGVTPGTGVTPGAPSMTVLSSWVGPDDGQPGAPSMTASSSWVGSDDGPPGAPSMTASSSWVGSEDGQPGAPSMTVLSSWVGSDDGPPGAPSMTASSSWVGSEDGWLTGLFAACLFILIHGRDGLAEGGQRDLTMAVCLIVATAFLFTALRGDWPWAAAAFGLFSGVALTIKPTALPLTAAQLLLAVHLLRRRGLLQPDQPRRWLHHTAAAFFAYLVAPAAVLVFLLRERALAAFLANLDGLVLYYAGLGHRPLSFLLLHSVSPLLPLVLLWFALLALRRPQLDAQQSWERAALLCGALFGLVSYLVQARGFPYYRYTLLIFLLPLMAADFTRAALTQESVPTPQAPSLRTKAVHCIAFAALAFGGFVLAPQSAVLVHRYRWDQTDFIASLQQDLESLGGQRLSGRIQCIDSISGCGNVLYRMRLQPANGLLVDFPLFGAGDVPFVRQTRQRFLAAMNAAPPQVIVVTSALYVDGPGDYRKLDRWPAFAAFLAARYTLQTHWSPTRSTRWWSREETPASYRIYLLRPKSLHSDLGP